MNGISHIRAIRFADSAVNFEFNFKDLLDAVDLHFKHCLGEEKTLVAQYQVRAGEEPERFSILRNGELFHSNIKFEQVLFHLMQDGLTQLNGEPKSHLIFHAAGLAYQERGLLLCGKSGSGKSTLTAWLTSKGFQYLSDEVIAYPLAGGEVSGFCRSLVLKRGSSAIWERWLEAASGGFMKMEDGSAWITPTLLNPSAVREKVQPHTILFPTYSVGADFKAEQLSTAGKVFHLMQCLVNARNFEDHGMQAVKKLAQTVTAYRVEYSDIEQAEEWIVKTLSS